MCRLGTEIGRYQRWYGVEPSIGNSTWVKFRDYLTKKSVNSDIKPTPLSVGYMKRALMFFILLLGKLVTGFERLSSDHLV
jgi:hypothetical protein